ncbi:MAG: hypothetical protein WCK51_10670 [Armatimonadota bacterium]
MRWFTTEELDIQKQKQLGLVIVGGLCFSVLSGFGIYALEAGRLVFTGSASNPTFLQVQSMTTKVLVGIAMSGIVLGVCVTLGGFVYGILEDKKKNLGIPRVLERARIIARYGVDFQGNYVNDERQFESHDDLRFFVRMKSPGEGSLEYECSRRVFEFCAEGTVGDAEIQGQWIRGYVAYRDMVESPVGQTI